MQSKPFTHELDSDVQTLMEVLSDIEMQFGGRFSLTGGFIRDYGERPYNDVDIVVTDVHRFERELLRIGLLRIGEEDGDNIPQSFFLNPYSSNELPIHFITADNEFADAPTHFDFTVNQLALKSDMLVYGSVQTWADLEKKVLRLNPDINLTTNTVMRAVRFSTKLGFTFEPKTRYRIVEFVSKLVEGRNPPKQEFGIASNRVVSGIEKMVEDGVAKESFELLQSIGFPHTDGFGDIMELDAHHRKLIEKGNAFIQDVRHYH